MSESPVRFCVNYSGGLTSYEAAKRIVERHGTDGVVLLFADTLIEDADLYRFLDETVEHLGCPLVRLCDGRNPWEVFRDEKFIGNTRVDPCSKILKRKLMDRWRDEHCDPATTTLVFGLDWSERGRIDRHRRRMQARGWQTAYPMDEKPYMTKQDIIDGLHAIGIEEPHLYKLGFPHNNCGGACVKMGLAQGRHLLFTLPDVYRWWEEQEQAALAAMPKAKPFLRFRSRKRTRCVSMKEFREIVQRQPTLFQDDGWGCGGGCAIDDEEEVEATA